jgi:hypothetical protein
VNVPALLYRHMQRPDDLSRRRLEFCPLNDHMFVRCKRARGLGLGFQVSGFRFQVSGFRFQVSGLRAQVSGFRFQVLTLNFEL